MPRVFTQKARNNIYSRGTYLPDPNTKSGKRWNRSIPADENDTLLVEKGQTYYRWSFAFGPTIISTTYPKRSQLTRSDFLSTWYDLEDSVGEATFSQLDELETFLEDLKTQVEELRDEQEEKKDNMPDSLEGSPSWEILDERYNGLEELYTELDNIDVEEFDEEYIREEEKDEEDEDQDLDSIVFDKRVEFIGEKITEISDAFSNVCF